MEVTTLNQDNTISNTIEIKSIDVNTSDVTLDDIVSELYKHIVDYCRNSGIKDYETKKPMICYVNRDAFLEYIKEEVRNC